MLYGIAGRENDFWFALSFSTHPYEGVSSKPTAYSCSLGVRSLLESMLLLKICCEVRCKLGAQVPNSMKTKTKNTKAVVIMAIVNALIPYTKT